MWLASCSKLVTTIAVLQCVERGLLHLDDAAEVDRLLPEWKNIEVLTGFSEDENPNLSTPTEKITLHRLLTHTSGVSYDFIHPLLVRWRQSRGETAVAFHSAITQGYHHPLVFEPGTGWTYGASLDLAGLMVARANDTTLEAYMRQNIFDVLGMNDTTFHASDYNNLIERLMPMTHRANSGELVEGAQIAPTQPVDDHGGAGLFSTAADYLKLLKSILHDDGKLVKSESIDLMFTPALSDAQRESLNLSLSHPKLAPIMIPGEPIAGTPGAGDWTHGLAGLIGLHKSDDGFQPG
jgi:CubicO group peptidase (beta-lactamase class C family)